MHIRSMIIVGHLLLLAFVQCVQSQLTEEEARQWLVVYNAEASLVYYDNVEASWNFNTNLTEYNQNVSLIKSAQAAVFDNEAGQNASMWNYNNFIDELTKREFSKIADIGPAILPEDKFNRMSQLGADMELIYSTAQVCNRPGHPPSDCFPLDPDLTAIMASSRDWNELVWAFEGWRNESGRKMPDMYEEYAALLNEAAVMNGYADNGAYWRSWYEMDGFPAECERLWQQVLPLYQQLHAYVRRKLREFYVNEADQFPSTGHIPAHLLGNMWAQSWTNIEPIVRPFANKSGVDVTEEMQRQGYDAMRMFQVSEEFFISLGLIGMPTEFWNKSMIERPADREVVCHASAWDFYNQVDFRIKQCTAVTHSWLMTTHHEMGHVEYFLQYAHQPVNFRDGANPGFHEAIGDVMSLSVSTPNHLQEIGLLPDYVDDPEDDMNFLMNQALIKVAFIPFGYLIDQWRWDLFAGETTRPDYNRDWWNNRCLYQGVAPPAGRLASDFDAGAKYHIPANTPYIRYFISQIVQFQFQKALCDEAGYVGPLHRCDVYRSTAAGQLIADMMQLGSSRPWPDALEAITGSRDMSAEPLLDYFRPLLDWLMQENAGYPIGWDSACPAGTIIG